MTRENEWFTRMQAFQLTKKYLESSASRVVTHIKPHTRIDQGIGARQIAEFLSVDGQVVNKR